MRFALPALALVAFALPATATEPEKSKGEQPAEAQVPAETKPAMVKDEKTCRYIRMDASSRRKEKVCLTKEGWVEFNQGN